MSGLFRWVGGLAFLAAVSSLGGCPVNGPIEFIGGGTGDAAQRGSTASVNVVSPTSNLSITGGAPVEVNWRAVSTTAVAFVRIVFDVDADPNNGNEIVALTGLGVAQTTAQLDTSRLPANNYRIVVLLIEQGEIAAFGTAPGRLVVNQRPQLFFTSPRDNFVFDRSNRVTPRFDVAWEVNDPDSTVTVEIFLDPDNSPNGNELKLRESSNQSGDSFSFDLSTGDFNAGTYRILALVSDGVDTFPFYAPMTIRIRNRQAGIIDLRNLDIGQAPVVGAVFQGFNPGDNLGSLVTSTRDIDGDGLGDFMMVAQFGKPQYELNTQRAGIGESYLIYGRPQRFTGVISVNSVGRLFRGDIYTGPPEVFDPIRPSRGITSFSTIADWDNDGVREFAFGVPFTDSFPIEVLDAPGYFRTGAVVITAGSSLRPDLGFPGGQVLNLAQFGTLTHEGNCDVPAPCPEGFRGPKSPSPDGGEGVTYYPRHGPALVCRNGVANLGAVRLGCRFSSNDFGDQFGEWLAPYDFEALIISAPNRDPAVSILGLALPNLVGSNLSFPGAGVISVYHCASDTGFYPWTSVNAPPAADAFNYGGTPESTGLNLLPHNGPYHFSMDEARYGAGGALADSPGYAVDPDDAEDPCTLESSAGAPNASNTFRLWSNIAGGRLSNATQLNDFNSDGFQDILVGQPQANNGRGAVYVVFGRHLELWRGAEFQLDELGLPSVPPGGGGTARAFDGLRIVGEPNTRLGTAVASAGDFNGDGLTDIVIGSPLLNNRRGGVVVMFGDRDVINLTEEELRFQDISSRGLGFVLEGDAEGDLAGAAVVGAGDIDGDGLDDILIAAPNKSIRVDIDLDGTIDIDRTECGVVYLIYGSRLLSGTVKLADVGTERLPGAIYVGRNSGDFLGAGLGDQGDISRGMAAIGDVDGDGAADLLLGSVRATPRNRIRAGEAYLIYGNRD